MQIFLKTPPFIIYYSSNSTANQGDRRKRQATTVWLATYTVAYNTMFVLEGNTAEDVTTFLDSEALPKMKSDNLTVGGREIDNEYIDEVIQSDEYQHESK